MQAKTILDNDQLLIFATGDPAGIGIEVILKALNYPEISREMFPILVGCRNTIEKTYDHLKSKGIENIANPKNIEIENISFEANFAPGEPTAKTGDISFQWLTRASQILIKNKAKALITAPICKDAWHQAGHRYPGQTERLAEITESQNASMLFTAKSPYNGWRLNTLLATTHIPIQQVTDTLTSKLINEKLDALLSFCKKFKQNPKLTIAGLNPHAGENGKLGKEEIELLIPAIKKWKDKNPNITVEGPVPPDTCWLKAANSWRNNSNEDVTDGFLALYHDQGLIPVKLISFDNAVNTTLGLPFIRTSPDHGTAFDIAGSGCAREESMLSAIRTAIELSKQ